MEPVHRLVVLGQRVAAHPLPLQASVTLGRDPGCDVVVDDPQLSPSHARLACDRRSLVAGGGDPDGCAGGAGVLPRGIDPLALEDLGSAAGTWVRGTRLSPGALAPIGCDEIFQLGSIAMVVQRLQRPGWRDAAAPVDPAGPAADRAARTGFASPAMRQLHQLVDRIAIGTISVLILGETGVGKEVLAETIHRRSTRAAAPLLRLNCAALTETLLESELFGHDKGAFTGAVHSKPGLLESAHGGTVFLDEIGELPPATQVKLLRVLESREVMRVGSLRSKPIDVRFIAATHRDLESRIEAGLFREDLYFRLNGVTLEIPPLRERRDELLPLAVQFIAAVARSLGRPAPELSRAALDRLNAHLWPGNIRELRNCIERAVLLAEAGRIDSDHVAIGARRARASSPPPFPVHGAPGPATLASGPGAIEREQIIAALARAAGNQKIAAQLLQISRRTLVYKLERFGIDRPRKGRAPG